MRSASCVALPCEDGVALESWSFSSTEEVTFTYTSNEVAFAHASTKPGTLLSTKNTSIEPNPSVAKYREVFPAEDAPTFL